MFLPTVLAHHNTDQRLTLTLEIDPNIEFFKGHFNDAPIIPGVAQLYWVLEFYNEFFQPNTRPIISNVSTLKFQQVIPPHSKVELSLEYLQSKNILIFSYANDNAKFSSGKIALS
ncbi:MAG: hydroxymyristoyl-ACP dehydratase [Kangiellaceae bacterium]|nr:hydroxymyristoyl-ACP dehydratase [Kangiellaceae bacterium]